MSALRQFLEQSRAVQVLLLIELTIFLSFSMLFPYPTGSATSRRASRGRRSDTGIGALFVMSSVMTLVGQIHVTEWCRRHYRPAEAIALGLPLMGLALLAPRAAALGPALGATAVGTDGGSGVGTTLTRLGPTMIAMALLSVGMLVVSPFSMAMVPRFARDRLIATYYGFYSMAGGLGTMTGNALLGAALDAQSHPALAALPGAIMVGIGAAAATALARKGRAVYHSAHARPLDGRRGDHAIQKRRRPTATLILLVRHGRTPTTGSVLPGRAPGLHLAEDGRKEAEVTAERIAKLKAVAAVYSSPLERARETAVPIAQKRGLEIRIEPGLIECEIGEWTGLELAKAAKLPEWTVVQRHPSGFRFPGGESFMEIQTRMADTLHALVARHPGETIVAVSHADPIKAAVAHALGTPLDLFQRIAIGTASVSAIAYGRTGPTVLTVNSTGGDLTAFSP